MLVTKTPIEGVVVIEPKVFGDDRGFFFESFNREVFKQATGLDPDFVQDNHSRSAKGVLRGLHYQLPPKAQGKLVRVVQGQVFDVAVDLRRSSPRFGQWAGARLSAEGKQQLWIPPGFAHGFLVLSDTAEKLSSCTRSSIRPWNPSSMPKTWIPCWSMAVFATARMTALSPGQSPPPVRMPMRLIWDGLMGVRRW